MCRKLVLILCIAILVIASEGIIKVENVASAKPKERSIVEEGPEDLLAARQKIEEAIYDAAKMKKLNLTPAAKDFIIKDMINREIYNGVPLSEISISPSEFYKLFDVIASKAEGKKVMARLAVSVVEEEKIKQESAMIKKGFSENLETTGCNLTDEAWELLQNDLLIQTEHNAKSGLSLNEMSFRNEGYARNVCNLVSPEVLDENAYYQAKKVVFNTLIKLTISSIPLGAYVEVAGFEIGQTTIEEKLVDAEREYNFIFKLPGYEDSVRKYYVNSYPLKQKLTEILIEK